MNNKINKNLIPQVIVDSVEKMLTEHNRNVRETYHQRVEAIREFCDRALQEYKRNGK